MGDAICGVNVVIVHGISTDRDIRSWYMNWHKAIASETPLPVYSIPVYWEDLMSNGHPSEPAWRSPRLKGSIPDMVGDLQAMWDRDVLERVHTGLRMATADENRAVIVLGHSLGSVLCYRALHEAASYVRNALFVTVGSPLGRLVRLGLVGVLQKPPCTHKWHNVWGWFDRVTFGPISQQMFTGALGAADHNFMTMGAHDGDRYAESRGFHKAIKRILDVEKA